ECRAPAASKPSNLSKRSSNVSEMPVAPRLIVRGPVFFQSPANPFIEEKVPSLLKCISPHGFFPGARIVIVHFEASRASSNFVCPETGIPKNDEPGGGVELAAPAAGVGVA